MPDARSSQRASLLFTLVLAAATLGTLVLLARRSPNEPAPMTMEPIEPSDEASVGAPGDAPFVPDLPPVPNLAERPAPSEPSPDPTGDALLAEMRLVSEARAALEKEPRLALDLLDQHRDRFPDGALSEEREGYAILAMIALEAPPGDVERRFGDLLARYPESRFASTIRAAIQRHEPAR